MSNWTILGIETSCDETAAAVYTTQNGVLSSVLHSQIAIHATFGGVVPELASRSHLEKISPIITTALESAHCTLQSIDAIAITTGPGLPGSLLVGVCFGKALAYALNKPIIGVHHLEGHIFSPHLENKIPFPHLCLTASGGHTAMYLVHDFSNYELLGQTVDDAAGEAFDKVAKLLELAYPGGPLLEKLARNVAFADFKKYPRLKKKGLDFSFSGLKTAVLYDLAKHGAYDMATKKLIDHDLKLKEQVASSLLVCIADIFENRLLHALELHPEIQAITFAGGVACNQYLRKRLSAFATTNGVQFFTPSPNYCTDNAAMIAFVGHYKAQQNKFDDLTLDIHGR